MASIEPLSDEDKFRRAQQALAASTKSDRERKGRARFGRALGLLIDRLTESGEAAESPRAELLRIWKECVAQADVPPDRIFRDEVKMEPYSRMCLYYGGNVLLRDLLYRPTETAVWQVFVTNATAMREVVIPFGVIRSDIPWVLSNCPSLNSKLKRPLQTYLAVPARQGASEVLLLPLDKQQGESDGE